MHVLSAKCLAMRDYQESVTTGQTEAGQSDPYVPLCLTGNTEIQGGTVCICECSAKILGVFYW